MESQPTSSILWELHRDLKLYHHLSTNEIPSKVILKKEHIQMLWNGVWNENLHFLIKCGKMNTIRFKKNR